MNAFDVIIIGFGKGGKTLTAEFAKRGQKVAIIERSDKMYGGTCINIGCIPTKTLVHQAKMASAMKDISFEEKSNLENERIGLVNRRQVQQIGEILTNITYLMNKKPINCVYLN